jgi:predicted DNA-binding protein (MmcQ/YjbR family)
LNRAGNCAKLGIDLWLGALMSLFTQKGFDAYAGTMAGVTFVNQWESRVAKVGGKVFVLLGDRGDQIVFKCSEETFEILTAMDGIAQAPYFAKRQWVTVTSKADLKESEIKTYIQRSYKLVAKGLTKKLRDELGIEIG